VGSSAVPQVARILSGGLVRQHRFLTYARAAPMSAPSIAEMCVRRPTTTGDPAPSLGVPERRQPGKLG